MAYLFPGPVNFNFGSFDYFCSQGALPVCSLVSTINPRCYSRNIEIGSTLIFEPAILVLHIIALVMTIIMISNIKSKYTAVGRKELVLFFYLYAGSIVLEFLVYSGIIPPASNVYPYAVALYEGIVFASIWCLFLNGFIPFQIIEDGTSVSLWTFRISSFLAFLVMFVISIITFLKMGLGTVALWVLMFVFNGIFLLVWCICQFVVVLKTLDDKWPLVDLSFVILFFLCSLIFEYAVANPICESVNHYVDGMFFGCMFRLLSVMMVYKYWDSITKEDLEFSVGGKSNVWEIRDPLLSDVGMAAVRNHQ